LGAQSIGEKGTGHLPLHLQCVHQLAPAASADCPLCARAPVPALLRAAQSKSDFLAFLCHELRNPLHAVASLVDFLTHSESLLPHLDDEDASHLETIEQQVKLMGRIVDDALDLSKIEAGKMQIESVAFNVKKLCLSLASGYKTKGQRIGAQARTQTLAGGMGVSCAAGPACRDVRPQVCRADIVSARVCACVCVCVCVRVCVCACVCVCVPLPVRAALVQL
jgi:signal transduction histidine kinase